MLGYDGDLINKDCDGHKNFIKQADKAMKKQFKKSPLKRWSEDVRSGSFHLPASGQWVRRKLLKTISTKTSESIGVVSFHEIVTYMTEAYHCFFPHISDDKPFLAFY